MTETPIHPTRIIPPGADLPARPPAPDEAPPWRAAPPPPPAPPAEPAWHSMPAPAPGPIEVRVTFAPYVPEPGPGRWERFTAWLSRFGRPWQAAAALTLAVTPIPFTGYSIATTWAYTVEQGRGIGPWQPYALGCIPFALVVIRIRRRGGSVRLLFLLAITGFGVYGALDWFDLVTIITGVTR